MAVARWLQDVAFGDVLDAGLEDGVWVVRRARLEVAQMPVLGERVALCTWCSGIGPRTAERRTTVEGDRGGAVEAVAVWAHLDPVTGVPARLGERFQEIYGPSAAHVNNAVYWAALEEGPVIPAACVVEAEHRAPAVAGPAVVVRDGDRTWVTSTQGEVHASFEVSAS